MILIDDNHNLIFNCNSRSLIPEDSEGRPRTQKSQSERRKVNLTETMVTLMLTKIADMVVYLMKCYSILPNLIQGVILAGQVPFPIKKLFPLLHSHIC